MSGMEYKGLTECVRGLTDMADAYAATAEKYLRRAGNALKREAINRSPVGGTADTTTKKTGRKRRNIKKLKHSWKAVVTGTSGSQLEYRLRSTAPQYHLVERGHVQKTPGGRITGFTPGTHFFADTVAEFERSGVIETQLEKFFDDVKRRWDRP